MKTLPPLPVLTVGTIDWSRDPHLIACIARNQYRMRRYAANATPYDLAMNHIRDHLGRGWTEEQVMDGLGHSGCIYYWIESGEGMRLKRGKIRAYVYGKGEQVFQVRQLLDTIKKTRTQRTLL